SNRAPRDHRRAPAPGPCRADWRRSAAATGSAPRCRARCASPTARCVPCGRTGWASRCRASRVEKAFFNGLDLQGEVFRVDAALGEAAGDEPQARLRRALERVAQPLAFAEAPHRADALGRLAAEELRDQRLRAL